MVKQGQVIANVNLEYVRSKGKSLVSPVIVTSGQAIKLHELKNVVQDQKIVDIY